MPEIAAVADPDDSPRTLPVEFSGRGGEFFGIWIVNILLSLLTLGIYSAWATVRTNRYFYGHTRLDGHRFEYLADPLQILAGRLIAVAVVILVVVAVHLLPPLEPLVTLLVFAVAPWLLVRALRFTFAMTRYRGLRFGFDGGLGQAYLVFLLLPLASIFTLGLAWPYAHYRMQRYIMGQARFGENTASYAGSPGEYYRVYGKLLLVLLLLGGLVAGLSAWLSFPSAQAAPLGVASAQAQQAPDTGEQPSPEEGTAVLALLLGGMGFVIMLIPALGYLALFVYVRAAIFNLTWGRTRLGPHHLQADLGFWPLLGMYLSNTLLIVFTLGLATPWAKVRMARLKMHSLALSAAGNLDRFLAGRRDRVGAVGDEVGEALDLNLGLGL